jgi:DNA-nicking Smr family endonuclease
MTDDENMDELIREYASYSDVQSAMKEKAAGEFVEEDIGKMTKDYPSPQRELDLHKMNGSEAKFEIGKFINSSQDQRIRTVRLIPGKGLHSQNQQSVLPRVTEQKLSELRKSGLVVNWKKEKSGGAFVVYLT